MSSQENPPPSFVDIGLVSRLRGVVGEIAVELFSGNPKRYLDLHEVWVQGRPYQVEHAGRQRQGLVLKLRGVDTPEDAKALVQATVQLPESALAPPPAESFYHFQIIGIRVVTADGRDLGTVQEIIETPGNDVYVTRGPLGEVLVPAIADIVKSVDTQRGVMVIEPIPGLLEAPPAGNASDL